jgi:hypothetical protein
LVRSASTVDRDHRWVFADHERSSHEMRRKDP